MSHQKPIHSMKALTRCVCCDHDDLNLVLDLGKQPLANSFKLNQDDFQVEYPLAINLCPKCFHVQLTHAVDPKLMFEDYLYVSGTAKTMHKHFEDFAKSATEEYSLYNDGPFYPTNPLTVLDIGCNDGTQLDYFSKLGCDTYGIDPAKNLTAESGKRHTIVSGFIDSDTVEQVQRHKRTFNIITAQNVFAHTADPHEFLLQVKKLMDVQSVLYIQTSQADMIKNNEFDTIYHEHISFFNTLSMWKLCKRAGMTLRAVNKTPIHGNSYIFKIMVGDQPNSKSVTEALIQEIEAGLFNPKTYADYARIAARLIDELKTEIQGYSRYEIGMPIVGYGAPAKGMTLINYGDLPIDFIIDDNPLKQGRFTPGSSIPIYSSEKLKEYEGQSICFVPLAWNFFDEIKGKIKTMRPDAKHDVFIRYFPDVRTEL